MTSKRGEAVVVGGGIVGLASAFRLAQSNCHVTLLDPKPGSGATWAAAGMIAPFAEIAPGEMGNFVLQRDAAQAWRDLSSSVYDVCQETITLVETGTLLVGFDASDRQMVAQFDDIAQSFGVIPHRVTRDMNPEMFEGASPRITEGLFLEGDAWLDPDQAVALLTDANERLGVSVVNETVREAGITGNEVVVTTDTQDIAGTFGILATGAHALPLGLRGQGVQEVRPVRGMTIRVQGPDRSTLPTIRAFVRGRSFYIVGRSAGYCVLGASSDEQEQLLVEVGDLHRLLRDGLDIIPSLENASFIETRQGLRPASKNLEPFFEVIDERWAWSSGHYRHGVTLAPLAAQQALAFSQGFA